MKVINNFILVIFGASGDLTKRKLIPALYELYEKKLLLDDFAILGLGRKTFSDDSFRNSIAEFTQIKDNQFLSKLYYSSVDPEASEDYLKLADRLTYLDSVVNSYSNYLFYLSTPPSIFVTVIENLAKYGLNKDKAPGKGLKKVIIEKPFGYDLESARELNKKITKVYNENQIYRIDHYLGKETVQNVMVTRFSNTIFEPLWNRNYIDHVQITAAETVGVESRAEYYDNSGALRDMIQNHLLQVLAMIAMEPPVVLDSNSIRNEALKVFQSLRPLTEEDIHTNVIRAQYSESTDNKAYINETGVPPSSKTETYVAMRCYLDNWRWKGVPFFIRTGKKLATRVSEIVIQFKPTPHFIFSSEGQSNIANQLIMRIQPDEGLLIKAGIKLPGAGYKVKDVNVDFLYSDIGESKLPEAYARLLLDAVNGDSTLYIRGDANELAWKFVDPILTLWKENPSIALHNYPSGSWGPKAAEELLFKTTGMNWRNPVQKLSGK